ncbi:MAG: methylamine utilization protein [Alphaproteobacteria bacterium]|nr:methylamine utilization protein [Alphaproteobacteria bacterium]
MKKTIVHLMVCSALSGQAYAADLVVDVSDQDGNPAANAVVSLTPQFSMTQMPALVGKAEMRQQGTMFVPFVLPVSVGATVSFPNFDEFRHQVYSFSKPKRFELRLYGQDESKTIQFDKPGVVALGCNIHDNMLAYIYVSTAPIVASTDSNGQVKISGLEAGAYRVEYWHPDMPTGGGENSGQLELTEGQETGVKTMLTLRSIRSAQKPPSEDEYN